jgi:hypothetical protein
MQTAWDELDPKTLNSEHLNPDDFEKPMVSPPTSPTPSVPQTE